MIEGESSRAKPRDPMTEGGVTHTTFVGFTRNDHDGEEHVPLFGSWRKAYAAVIVVFAVDVVLFYAITHYFA